MKGIGFFGNRLGGAADTFALAAISSSILTTSPFFSGLPTAPSYALAGLGAAWVAGRCMHGMAGMHLFRSKLNIRSSDLLSSDGMLIGYTTDRGRAVRLPDEALPYHGMVAGRSGYGKTTFARLMMLQQIIRGGGLLMIDAKLDSDDMSWVAQVARWAGRYQDMQFINLGDPANSNSYNSVLEGDPDEVADRILTSLPAPEVAPAAEHYRQSAKQALGAIVGGVQALGLAYNCIDLSILLHNERALSELEERLRSVLPHHPATKNLSLWIEQYRGGFGNDTGPASARINMKRLKETLGGIAGRLHAFGTGTFGEVGSSYSPDVRLFDSMMSNKITYVSLPTMGKDESARNFAKMLLADLRSAIARIQQLPKSHRSRIPYLALLDEFGAYALMAMNRVFEQARSAGISVWAMFQSIANLDAVSPDFRDMLEENTDTKLFFKLASPKTTEEAAKMIGKGTFSKTTISATSRASESTPKITPAPEGGLSTDAGYAIAESEEEQYRVTEDDLKKVDRGECIMLYQGCELFNLRIPNITISKWLSAKAVPIRVNRTKRKQVKGCDYFKNADRYLTAAKAARA
ncbi:type IV secretory system conjugative DNA transfer family protein [Achromobacter xylosoxidans]